MKPRIMLALIASFTAIPMGLVAQHEHEPDQTNTPAANVAGGTMDMMGQCYRMTDAKMGQGGVGSMMGQGGMGSMMGQGGPSALLRQREALDLTPDQVRGMEGLETQAAKMKQNHMGTMGSLAARRHELMGEPSSDLDELEDVLSEEAAVRVAMQMEAARAARESLDLLTEEQRSNLDYGRRLMSGMMKKMSMHETPPADSEGNGAHVHESKSGR